MSVKDNDSIDKILEELDNFSLSDIPEDNSSEKPCQTPFPESTSISNISLTEVVMHFFNLKFCSYDYHLGPDVIIISIQAFYGDFSNSADLIDRGFG